MHGELAEVGDSDHEEGGAGAGAFPDGVEKIVEVAGPLGDGSERGDVEDAADDDGCVVRV